MIRCREIARLDGGAQHRWLSNLVGIALRIMFMVNRPLTTLTPAHEKSGRAIG